MSAQTPIDLRGWSLKSTGEGKPGDGNVVPAKESTFYKEIGRRSAPKHEVCIAGVACDDAVQSAMRSGSSLGIREPPFVGEQVLRLMQP